MAQERPKGVHEPPVAVVILLVSLAHNPEEVFPTAWMAVMTTARISARSMAYSAAVGPSSSRKNPASRWSIGRTSLNIRNLLLSRSSPGISDKDGTIREPDSRRLAT